MNKTRAKKLPSKKIICISAFMLGIIMLVLGVTYAWFRNTIDLSGINMKTGTFKYQFAVYSADATTETVTGGNGESTTRKKLNRVEAYSTEAKDGDNSGFKPMPDGSALIVTSVKTDITVTNQDKGEIFFVVKKLQGSVNLDVSISLESALDDLLKFDEKIESEETPEGDGEEGKNETTSTDDLKEILGGFWYTIDNVTGKANGLAAVEDIIRDESTFKSTTKENYFPNIRNEIQDARLDTDDYWVFRLCYGLHDPATIQFYTDREFTLAADLCVAQVGGLEGQSTVNVHRVSTLERLRTALLEYKPNDKIIIEGDIIYEGDFIINRPLTLAISNSTLTVKGNMRYIYASSGSFTIDTSSAGHLRVIEMGDGIDAGGNFYADIPESTLEIKGHNSDKAGMADIYVENELTLDVGYEETITPGNEGITTSGKGGFYLTRARICYLNDVLHELVVRNQSSLNIDTRTYVGTITAPNSKDDITKQTTRIKIVNHGNIEKIDLRFMVQLLNGTVLNPAIFIDNYGNIEKDGSPSTIILPTWSAKWALGDSTKDPRKNTRIIHQQGASEMHVSGATGSGAFVDADIENATRDTIVDKLDKDGTKIIVHYMEDDAFAAIDPTTGEKNYYNLTLKNIIEYYQKSSDLNDSQKIAETEKIVYLEIICYGKYSLTTEDYATITSMTQLNVLDLVGATSAVDPVTNKRTVPDYALKGLKYLYQVSMPEDDEVWGDGIFDGCESLEELTLPNSLTELGPSTVKNIKYLHIGALEELVCVDGTDWQNKYLFCADTATKNNVVNLIWNSQNYGILAGVAPE